jgi:hypothetical protein
LQQRATTYSGFSSSTFSLSKNGFLVSIFSGFEGSTSYLSFLPSCRLQYRIHLLLVFFFRILFRLSRVISPDPILL